MILTSWLPVWNMALGKLEKEPLPTADLTSLTTKEAKKVNLYWDAVLGRVLADHDILVAVKTIFLGSATTEFTPNLPVGATELASADTIRKYYFTLPPFDSTGSPAAGSVPFDIVRTISLSNGSVFDPRGKKLFVPSKVEATNVYADVVVKPTPAEAGADDSFCWALALALAYDIAAQVAGKDRYRDAKLQAEYDDHIANSRYYDATQGRPSGEPDWWSPLSGQTEVLR